MTDLVRILETVRPVAEEYGIAPADLKPCIAYLLDGNGGGAPLRKVAFTIAIELRRIGWAQSEVTKVLAKWATKVGCRQSAVASAVNSAFRKKPGGEWLYLPPGLKKGSTYSETIKPICDDVGCPANCAPFAHVHQGPRSENFGRFEKLGWARYLRQQRRAAAADYYRAVCRLEEDREVAPGAEMLVSYKQLAERAERDYSAAGENLDVLLSHGLLSKFTRGSGSGPHARDRVPSRVRRQVPIPPPPSAALTTGGAPRPPIGAGSPPTTGSPSPPHIGGRQDPSDPARHSKSWGGIPGTAGAFGRKPSKGRRR